MDMKFYHCEICEKVIAVISEDGIPTECCGQDMILLEPKRADSSTEKHVPVFSVEGTTVKVHVGSTLHPMTEEHGIRWIGLSTDRGFQFKELHPGDAPEACFCICGNERVLTVYSYCNLHGLWCNDTAE